MSQVMKSNTGAPTSKTQSVTKLGFFTKMKLKHLDKRIDNLREAMKWDINRHTKAGEKKYDAAFNKLKNLEQKMNLLKTNYGIKD
jgi:hypothetical protein